MSNLFNQSKTFLYDENVMSLVFDTLFTDFSSVRLFSETDMYYQNDIVFVKKDISGDTKDSFYICNSNTYKGQFNKINFSKFQVHSNSKRLLHEKRFVSNLDETKIIPLDIYIDKDRVSIVIHHSTKGKIILEKDWVFKSENSIELKEGLFNGEYIDIEIYQ